MTADVRRSLSSPIYGNSSVQTQQQEPDLRISFPQEQKNYTFYLSGETNLKIFEEGQNSPIVERTLADGVTDIEKWHIFGDRLFILFKRSNFDVYALYCFNRTTKNFTRIFSGLKYPHLIDNLLIDFAGGFDTERLRDSRIGCAVPIYDLTRDVKLGCVHKILQQSGVWSGKIDQNRQVIVLKDEYRRAHEYSYAPYLKQPS